MRAFSYALVFCAFLSIMAVAQTKNPAAAPPKRPATSAERIIPPIKCVDHDTATACKSFRQLVDARDDRLIRAVWGEQGHNNRHISYVCLRPQADAFNVIEFDIPDPKAYLQPYTLNEDMAKSADDPHPTSPTMREIAERSKKLMEDSMFEDFSDPPAVSQYTKDQWFQDHSKDFVYALGLIADFRYQDGLDKSPALESGEWSMLASSKGTVQHEPPAWFTGAYSWIEKFNRQHDDVSARDDEPERAHISADPASIYIHYKFENPAQDMVDYTMQINRLTGRFVENFKFPDSNEEASGTCMIFK